VPPATKGDMNLLQTYRNLPIRHKLLYTYSSAFALIVVLSGLVAFSILRKTVEANIESELKNSTSAILNMVRTSVSASIKNHLRAVAEKNREVVTYFYDRYRQGLMTETEAKAMAEAVLLTQKIGTTGYIACVDSAGTMVIHPQPAWVGVDISDQAFVKEMIAHKEGYLEYEWQNPGDVRPRPKALYMTYFEPWDWIIDVSSYRDEFHTLVNVNDFRESVLGMRFGRTGYSFVTDSRGNIVIHPQLQGINIFRDESFPHEPLRRMLTQKNGKIIYDWQNPGEQRPRRKLVIFNAIPEYDWIVASSSYMDEFYRPLNTLNRVILFSALASLLLVLPMSFLIGLSITNPLRDLVDRLERGAEGDFSVRVHQPSRDEIGQLADYFNHFMERLEIYSRNLESEIAERRQAEEALRISEGRYRSVMEAAPDPIIVYDMKGRVTYMNAAFARVFGWTPEECLGRKMDHFVPSDTWEETRRGLALIAAGKMLSTVETRRLTKSGKVIHVSVRGAVYRDLDGQLAGSVIIHRDVSELKRMEKQLMEIGDRERQKIGQDLHDDLCPHLIGIEGLAKVLCTRLARCCIEVLPLAEQITDLIREATTKSRGLARGLCPVYLVDRGLVFALRELAMKTESFFGAHCRFSADPGAGTPDNTAATQLFYIAQEAVNNAIRHGKARNISIQLQQKNDQVVLTVDDDGCGMEEVRESGGMGLQIMDFRAKMISGNLTIRSQKGEGTLVQVVLPPPIDEPLVDSAHRKDVSR